MLFGAMTIAFLHTQKLALIEPVSAEPAQTTSGTTGVVELRIFIGQANPTWFLSEEDTETAFSILAKLPSTRARKISQGLGYRGFRVNKVGTLSRLPHEFEVYKGVASDGVNNYRDKDRRLELWLLRSGKEHLDKQLYAAIECEINSTGR